MPLPSPLLWVASVVLAVALVPPMRQLTPAEALRRMMGPDIQVDSPELPERVVKLLRDSGSLMSPD